MFIALLELENAWGQDKPGAPLPVTIGDGIIDIKRKIETLDDVKEALKHYCDKIPYAKVLSIASHLSTDISYHLINDEEMRAALQRRSVAGETERNVYANYIQESFLTELEKRNANILFAVFHWCRTIAL